MVQEKFERNKRLTLFDCHRSRIEEDGYYDLSDERDDFPVLSLRDTAMSPQGWSDCEIKLGCSCFDEGAKLTLIFGKPFHNDKEADGRSKLVISRKEVVLETNRGRFCGNADSRDGVLLKVKDGKLTVNGCEFEVEPEELLGYMEMYCVGGVFRLCSFTAESSIPPFTREEHKAAIISWRKKTLNQADKSLDALEKYLEEKPDALPRKTGDIIIPERLVDKGAELTVKLVSYGECNGAFLVTEDCFSEDAVPTPYYIDLKKDGDTYSQEITLRFDVPGNTKLEFWVNGERIVRQIAVLDAGYLAVIPWVGSNSPMIDEEIHRFDIPGDYWMDSPGVESCPEKAVDKYRGFVQSSHKYGDRVACFVNGKTIMPNSETDSLFELDRESQERGLGQLDRQMKILGFDKMELVASYTPDAVSIDIMEKLGVKGLTSLCAWQNWEDGGWRINHCGVSNQPYYPADDDFRRAGEKRDIMCFTMGSSSCNRNYSIMVLDGCPSNIVPGERYFDHRVIHYNVQRFYDIFDGYIADSKNNDKTIFATIALESFRGFMDWHAVNDLAVRYMVKKAAKEKIVFTSAADISDYHKKRDLDLHEAYFCQPDYYYGYHNGEMPGRVADRIEAVTPEYLAVVRRDSGLPMYFYDYEKPWESVTYEDAERNEFGLVNPDTNKPSECLPKQIFTEDMTVETEIHGDRILLYIESETKKDKMVAGVFDVPFEADFKTSCDTEGVKVKKVSDLWTGNTHLFVDLGKVPAGKSVVEISVSGTPRTPVNAESIKGDFAAMWFGDHAYLRCRDKDSAIKVEMDAPKTACLLLQSGEKICTRDGKLCFVVNKEWFNEAPMLTGYPREEFEDALETAKIEGFGATNCSRWSGQ